MFPTHTAAHIGRIAGTIDLEISDPVLILNEIARRYETTERVLMEYVDNALDDAEVLYRENEGRYPYPIKIELTIDFEAQQVTIKDNCRGMPRVVLERVIRNIGESQKRGVTWVNGQFGFGVQAFRAAAQTVQFETKHLDSSGYILELSRDQHRGIKEAKRTDEPFPSDSGSGTLITLSRFDPAWFNFSVDSIKAEIEHHFERLIARPNLHILVGQAGQEPVPCVPFDYDRIDGQAIRQTLQLPYRNEIYPVEVYLKVAAAGTNRPASFFARGRRVNHIAEIKSFIRKSTHKTGLWSHANLLGYIEVGELVRLAITRDDFDRTRGRQVCYDAILALEPEIKKLINRVNKASKQKTLVKLESAVGQAVANVIEAQPQADTSPAAAAPAPAAAPPATGSQPEPAAKPSGSAATPPPPQPAIEPPPPPAASAAPPKPAEPPAGQYTIHFSDTPPAGEKPGQRSYRAGNAIQINTAHPDFKTRLKYTRQGAPVITDRLYAYLAGIISLHYPDSFAPPAAQNGDVAAWLAAQVDFIFKLEAALREQRSTFERELAG